MNRNTTASIAGIALFALLFLVLLSLSGNPPAPGVPGVRIAAPALEQNALIYVAMDRGFFSENGLNVTIREDYQNGVAPVHDMAAGDYELSVSAEYPVISCILAGENISIIAGIDRYQNEELIGRKDAGIQTISDLRGRRIGLPRGTILEFFLGRLLELHGLGIGDVTLVDVNATHATDAIAGGEVDAIMYFQPHTAKIRDRLGDNAIIWPGQSNQSLYGVVAARDDWIAGHPDEARRFLQALTDAEEYAFSHPEETKAVVKMHMNQSDAYLADVWPDHRFSLSLDQSLLVAMNDEARWAIANNMTSAKVLPDFHSHISTSGLACVNPRAVNLR